MKISDFELTSISLSANTDPNTQHDFTNVHHGFLSLKEIIPDNWVVNKADFTQSSSSLEYENGVQFAGDPREFQVAQTEGLHIDEESTALKLMIQYLTLISPDTFRLMGVQLDLQARHEDPHGWITDKFIRSDFSAHGWKQVQPVLILSTLIEDMIVSFAFLTGQEVADEHSIGLLRVNHPRISRTIFQ